MLLDCANDGDSHLADSVSVSAKRRACLKPLFPDVSEDQLDEVAETLHAYCATVWRIYERLKRERPEVIDELMRSRTMKGKVDSSTQSQTL
jgi:hypothetical protein